MYGVLLLVEDMFVPGLCLIKKPAQLLQSLPGQPRQQVLHSINLFYSKVYEKSPRKPLKKCAKGLWARNTGSDDFLQSFTLQRQFRLYIPFLGIARPQPQFTHSRVCGRFIYSQDRSHISSSRKGRPIVGIYNSLTDTWMWKLGLSPRYSFSGNICFKFSAFCLCSVETLQQDRTPQIMNIKHH